MEDRKLEIRRFEKKDEDAVFEVHLKAIGSSGAHLAERDADFKDIESLYIESGGEFLVGMIDGQIVAVGGLKKMTDDIGEIHKMRVHPLFQQQGFGPAILHRLEQRARELGFNVLQLDTAVLQTGAQKLYEKNGYKEYKRGEVGGFSCIYYRKML